MTEQVGVPVRFAVPRECTMHGRAGVLKMELADAAIPAAEALPALPGAAVYEVRAARETDALAAGHARGGERATTGGVHG